MQYVLINILLTWLSLQPYSQTKELAGLSVGNKVPDIVISGFMDRPSRQLRMSDLKGKLVLLDFWNIWCGSCIGAMPKMEALQQAFGDKIQIILVTKNNGEEVRRLFNRIKIKRPDLPMIISDKSFNALFPHEGEPHHVWIDSNGIVKYITHDFNATANNIQAVLDGKHPTLSAKADLKDFDDSQPLITEGMHRLPEQLESYSIVFKGLYQYTPSNRIFINTDPNNDQPITIRAVNASVLTLYTIAFARELFDGNIDFFRLSRNNRIIFETKDPQGLLFPQGDSADISAWLARNVFCYESVIPKERADKIYKIMQQDINRYFDYDARIEQRKVKCLVLSGTGREELIKTKHKDIRPPYPFNPDGSVSIRNMPLSTSLVTYLIYANCDKDTPIIDETTYKGGIDMDIKCQLNDIPGVDKTLRQYGLTLTEAEREIDMLVIRDK